MKTIKFRAWDKKSHKMREIDSIAFHKKSDPFDLGSSNTPKVINVWGYDCIEQEDIILHREENEVELMQSTGLKDKNGVEIYDGDIILAGYYKWMCKVVWDDKCARFIALTNDKDVKIVYIDMVDKNDISAIEVIGNIYENPDLLEVQHED